MQLLNDIMPARVERDISVYDSVVALVIDSSVVPLSLTASSDADEVHAVIFTLQQHFQWQTDVLSSLNASQFRLSRAIVTHMRKYDRAGEELGIVKREFIHAANYYK